MIDRRTQVISATRIIWILVVSFFVSSCETKPSYQYDLVLDIMYNRPANYPEIDHIKIFEIDYKRQRIFSESDLIKKYDYWKIENDRVDEFISTFERRKGVDSKGKLNKSLTFQVVIYLEDGRMTTFNILDQSQSLSAILSENGSFYNVGESISSFMGDTPRYRGHHPSTEQPENH